METAIAYREEFVCWVPNRPGEDPTDHEHDSKIPCEWGWACNVCGARIDDGPCSAHAPSEFPGLRPAECLADPKHHWFGYDADDYGLGCPTCSYVWAMDRLRQLEKDTHGARHWPWRRWRLTNFLLYRVAYPLRLVRGSGTSNSHTCRGCIDIRWRWRDA